MKLRVGSGWVGRWSNATTTFGYELVSVEQTQWGKLFELGGGVVSGRGVITHIPPTKYHGKTLRSFESWGERFFSNCIPSVNCQLVYSRKERVPTPSLLLFSFGCFRVWHQEISSSSSFRTFQRKSLIPPPQCPYDTNSPNFGDENKRNPKK